LSAPDFDTVLAKIGRAKEHAGGLTEAANDFFTHHDTYELVFEFDREAKEIDVYGRFGRRPPVADFGAIFGDFLNCYRSALDHIVWALSVRCQHAPPPPYPIP
jgi:hypothetical protein